MNRPDGEIDYVRLRDWNGDVRITMEWLDHLEARLKSAEDALEFYGERWRTEDSKCGPVTFPPAMLSVDAGRLARAHFAKYPAEQEKA